MLKKTISLHQLTIKKYFLLIILLLDTLTLHNKNLLYYNLCKYYNDWKNKI